LIAVSAFTISCVPASPEADSMSILTSIMEPCPRSALMTTPEPISTGSRNAARKRPLNLIFIFSIIAMKSEKTTTTGVLIAVVRIESTISSINIVSSRKSLM
jgi:hypothetical protein